VNTATITCTDGSVGANLVVQLTSTSATTGTFRSTVAGYPSFYQTGTFSLPSGLVPTTLRGMTFSMNVLMGVSPFANSGTSRIIFDAQSDTYQVVDVYGNQTSSGSFSYSPGATGSATLYLTDSVYGAINSQTLSWRSGTSGVYYIESQSGSYQAGTFTAVQSVIITPPSITSQPSSLTVNGDSLASFSVTASGTAPLSYQWRKNSVNVAGGTSSTCVIASAQTTDAGSYSVVVSNSAGSVTSASASLTVNSITSRVTNDAFDNAISLSPLAGGSYRHSNANATSEPGEPNARGRSLWYQFSPSSNGSFTVDTVGSGWDTYLTLYRGGSGLNNLIYIASDDDGGGTRTSRIQNVHVTAGTIYHVQFDSYDAATTGSFYLNWRFDGEPVSITSQPSFLTVSSGNSASFSVTAAGTAPLSYQWRKDGTNIVGGTSSTYRIASAQTSDAGSYSVVVSNSVGSVTSGSARLTVRGSTSSNFLLTQMTVRADVDIQSVLEVSPFGVRWENQSWGNRPGSLDGSGYAPTTINGVDWYAIWPDDNTRSVGLSDYAGSDFGYFNGPVDVEVLDSRMGTSYASVEQQPSELNGYTLRVTLSDVVFSGSAWGTVKIKSTVTTPTTIASQPASLAVSSGNPATFSVTATGTAPLSYQWRKNGTNLSGGTSSTYVIVSAQTTDAGNYSVVVSNAAGSVTSASASLTVNKITPVIAILPTASPITSGQSLTASVLSGGSASVAGIFAFTSPSTVPSVGTTSQSVTFTPTDSSRYTPVSTALSVTVNAAVGLPVITSATTATGTVGSAFNYQIAGTNTPSSYTATGLPAGLTVNSFTGVISGMPSIAGQSLVTLGALNSGGTGSATLSVSILAAGTGGTGTVSWTDLVGTYEGLLEQNPDSPTDDMAVYRGAFSLTFNKTGTVSGRVFYNEATALDGPQNRVYVPVIRTFVGLLTASSANSLTYQKVIRLGTGTSLGRQELTLDVSFEETPPRLSVTVKDTASPSAGEDAWVSQALSCSRSLTKLPASTSVGGGTLDYSKAVGRYTLSATDGDPTGVNNVYVLAQVLSTGKVLWTSRMKGTLGTGSTGLRVTSDGLDASFYEGRVSSTSNSLKSRSLVGSLNFVWDSTSGSWSSNFGSDTLPRKIEKQASCVSKTGGRLVFNDAQDSTGVTELDFSNQDGVRWGNTTVTTVPAFLSGGTLNASPFILNAQDPPDSDGNTASYTWNVSVTAAGRVLTTSTTDETGVLSPRLLLTLNRQNGEFTGYYMSNISGKNVRRNIYGCGFISQTDDALRARGWVESGALPTLSTGGWTLQLGQ
jgi:hypothetical protein